MTPTSAPPTTDSAAAAIAIQKATMFQVLAIFDSRGTNYFARVANITHARLTGSHIPNASLETMSVDVTEGC